MSTPPSTAVTCGRTVAAMVAVAAATAFTVAQQPSKVAPPKKSVTITTAAKNELIGGMPAYARGSAPARNGALFVFAARSTYRDAEHKELERTDLELWRSDDGGLQWRRANVVPTVGNSDGSIVPDGDLLACLWTTNRGGKWSCVCFQRYDPRNDTWVGEPQALAIGDAEENQYFSNDLTRTARGDLVAAIGSHRSPPAPWNCGWSTGTRWLPAGGREWTPIAQVNVNSYGCAGNVSARGDCVDFVYRTNPGFAIHGLRTLDCKRGEFVQQTDDCAMAAPAANSHICNVGILCCDDQGGRTLLHVLGDHNPGAGRLAVSFARPGEDWRTVDLEPDAPLIAGNENPTHYVLSRGPGNQVFCWFGKQSEEFAHLWHCVLEDGKPAVPPRRVQSGAPGSFASLNGMRCDAAFCGLHATACSHTAANPGGELVAYGNFPSKTVWRR